MTVRRSEPSRALLGGELTAELFGPIDTTSNGPRDDERFKRSLVSAKLMSKMLLLLSMGPAGK